MTPGWNVVCISYIYGAGNTATIRANINGVATADSTNFRTMNSLTTGTFSVADTVGDGFFGGSIARFTIWNGVAFTAAQLQQMVKGYMGLLGSGGEQLSLTRTTTRTCLVPSGTYTLAAGAPCIGNNGTGGGLQVEPQSTNFFLTSNAPATQTITLTTTTPGSASWVLGSGSLAGAVGTGTATGLPCTASAGSPCLFTVTSNGTFVFTKSGTLTFAQVEQNAQALATSEIDTAGAAVTRNADVIVPAATPILDPSGGICATVYIPNGFHGNGVSPVVVGSTSGAGEPLFVSSATGVSIYDGVNIPSTATSSMVTAPRQICSFWDATKNIMGAFQVGGAAPTTAVYSGSVAATIPSFGQNSSGGTGNLNGYISNLCFTRVGSLNGTSQGVGGCP
jgi:hypothetical protein